MGESKTEDEEEQLPLRGTQPVAMDLHTEPLVKEDSTVVCRALKHVQS
jgi:hypothetical protein